MQRNKISKRLEFMLSINSQSSNKLFNVYRLNNRRILTKQLSKTKQLTVSPIMYC